MLTGVNVNVNVNVDVDVSPMWVADVYSADAVGAAGCVREWGCDWSAAAHQLARRRLCVGAPGSSSGCHLTLALLMAVAVVVVVVVVVGLLLLQLLPRLLPLPLAWTVALLWAAAACCQTWRPHFVVYVSFPLPRRHCCAALASFRHTAFLDATLGYAEQPWTLGCQALLLMKTCSPSPGALRALRVPWMVGAS